jgi:predicted DNA-binding protein YlxM (UPF0122 family)
MTRQVSLPNTHSGDYRDPDRLRRLYWDEGMSLGKIAEELKVAETTVYRWFRKHGISRRAEYHHLNYTFVPYRTDKEGYERWRDQYRNRDGEKKEDVVAVHRLAAVAWFGYESVLGRVVHHDSKIPWDNRESNLDLMQRSDHSSYHNRERS